MPGSLLNPEVCIRYRLRLSLCYHPFNCFRDVFGFGPYPDSNRLCRPTINWWTVLQSKEGRCDCSLIIVGSIPNLTASSGAVEQILIKWQFWSNLVQIILYKIILLHATIRKYRSIRFYIRFSIFRDTLWPIFEGSIRYLMVSNYSCLNIGIKLISSLGFVGNNLDLSKCSQKIFGDKAGKVAEKVLTIFPSLALHRTDSLLGMPTLFFCDSCQISW